MSFECLFARVKWLRFFKGMGADFNFRRTYHTASQQGFGWVPLRLCLSRRLPWWSRNYLLLCALFENILQSGSIHWFHSFVQTKCVSCLSCIRPWASLWFRDANILGPWPLMALRVMKGRHVKKNINTCPDGGGQWGYARSQRLPGQRRWDLSWDVSSSWR